MSIDSCKWCGASVDTDDDTDAYTVTTSECDEIKLEYCLCRNCRGEFSELVELKKKTAEFSSEIFDWVSMLGEIGLLAQLDAFERAIEEKTNPKRVA